MTPQNKKRHIPPRNERVDAAQHVDHGLVHAQEYAVVDLTQAQELQNLARLRRNTVDTIHTHPHKINIIKKILPKKSTKRLRTRGYA